MGRTVMAKKAPLLPVSPEVRDALLRVIAGSREPMLAKAMATLLTPDHAVVEAQLTPVLEEYVEAGKLQKYPAATGKGKARYWDRDLQQLIRDGVLAAIQSAATPLTAKELIGKIDSIKVSELQATSILDGEVADGSLFAFPPTKPKGKVRYWHRDLKEIVRTAIQEAATRANEPCTAKDLAGQLTSPVKLTEAEIAPVLEQLVSTGALHAIPPASTKGKPRYWGHDVLELGRRTIASVIDTKGPQTLGNLKKVLKGFSEPQSQQILERLRAERKIVVHPPMGGVKQELYGTRPPAPASYLKDVAAQLVKVVAVLRSAQVPMDELRRTVIQLVEEAGISFGASGTIADTNSNTSGEGVTPATVDLIALMKRIEPGAERGALVGARDLRRTAHLPKREFDHAVLELARSGRLSLHRHDYATSLSQDERDELVTDGDGTFYVGMALRPQ